MTETECPSCSKPIAVSLKIVNGCSGYQGRCSCGQFVRVGQELTAPREVVPEVEEAPEAEEAAPENA